MFLFLAYQWNNIYLGSALSLFVVINAMFTFRKNDFFIIMMWRMQVMDAPKLGFLPLLAKWVLWLELSIIELLLLHWYLSSLILFFLKKKDLGEWNLHLVDRMRKYKTVRATKQTKVKGWVIFFIKDKVQVSEHKNGGKKS